MKRITYDEAKSIIQNAPEFIKTAINFNEVLYCLRTKVYVERGVHIAKIQLEEGSNEAYTTTMSYHSSFYDECVKLSDLKTLVENIESQELTHE